MYQLEIQQDGFFPRVVAFGGIIIVLLSVAFLVFLVISRQQQNRLLLKHRALAAEFEQQLLQAQMEVQEYTLFQLGQELHDNIGQLLSSTKLLLGVTERGLQQVPDSLRTAENTLGKAIQDLRSLTKSLNAEWLHQFNLVENLRSEVERIQVARQIAISFHADAAMLPLEPKEQVIAFRVIQEAIQNSIKHSGAATMQIDIAQEEGKINISVADDGQGFDPEDKTRSGIGIMNMKHRIKLLGGSIRWEAGQSAGTKVSIVLPTPIQNSPI
jgi:two-component system, NarL family, sensor kinase